jgi:hypothetical protein
VRYLWLLACTACLNQFDRSLLDSGTGGGTAAASTELLAAGERHTCATHAGALYCFGWNAFAWPGPTAGSC